MKLTNHGNLEPRSELFSEALEIPTRVPSGEGRVHTGNKADDRPVFLKGVMIRIDSNDHRAFELFNQSHKIRGKQQF